VNRPLSRQREGASQVTERPVPEGSPPIEDASLRGGWASAGLHRVPSASRAGRAGWVCGWVGRAVWVHRGGLGAPGVCGGPEGGV